MARQQRTPSIVQINHKALKELRELRVGGKIAQMVTARKEHKCSECGLPIEPRTEYYRVYLGGAGLGNLKHPEHIHIHCFHKEPEQLAMSIRGAGCKR